MDQRKSVAHAPVPAVDPSATKSETEKDAIDVVDGMAETQEHSTVHSRNGHKEELKAHMSSIAAVRVASSSDSTTKDNSKETLLKSSTSSSSCAVRRRKLRLRSQTNIGKQLKSQIDRGEQLMSTEPSKKESHSTLAKSGPFPPIPPICGTTRDEPRISKDATAPSKKKTSIEENAISHGERRHLREGTKPANTCFSAEANEGDQHEKETAASGEKNVCVDNSSLTMEKVLGSPISSSCSTPSNNGQENQHSPSEQRLKGDRTCSRDEFAKSETTLNISDDNSTTTNSSKRTSSSAKDGHNKFSEATSSGGLSSEMTAKQRRLLLKHARRVSNNQVKSQTDSNKGNDNSNTINVCSSTKSGLLPVVTAGRADNTSNVQSTSTDNVSSFNQKSLKGHFSRRELCQQQHSQNCAEKRSPSKQQSFPSPLLPSPPQSHHKQNEQTQENGFLFGSTKSVPVLAASAEGVVSKNNDESSNITSANNASSFSILNERRGRRKPRQHQHFQGDAEEGSPGKLPQPQLNRKENEHSQGKDSVLGQTRSVPGPVVTVEGLVDKSNVGSISNNLTSASNASSLSINSVERWRWRKKLRQQQHSQNDAEEGSSSEPLLPLPPKSPQSHYKGSELTQQNDYLPGPTRSIHTTAGGESMTINAAKTPKIAKHVASRTVPMPLETKSANNATPQPLQQLLLRPSLASLCACREEASSVVATAANSNDSKDDTPHVTVESSVPKTPTSNTMPTQQTPDTTLPVLPPQQQRLIVSTNNEVEMKLLPTPNHNNANRGATLIELKEEKGLNRTTPSSTIFPLDTASENEKHEVYRHERHLRNEPLTAKERVSIAHSYDCEFSLSSECDGGQSLREEVEPRIKETSHRKDDVYNGDADADAEDSQVAIQGTKSRQPMFMSERGKMILLDVLEKDQATNAVANTKVTKAKAAKVKSDIAAAAASANVDTSEGSANYRSNSSTTFTVPSCTSSDVNPKMSKHIAMAVPDEKEENENTKVVIASNILDLNEEEAENLFPRGSLVSQLEKLFFG